MTTHDDAKNSEQEDSALVSRRNFMETAAIATGGLTALGAGTIAAQEKKQASTVALDWKEVYYTNCPLVSASNVDQELGWTKEEYSKIGVEFAYFRSRRETNWYPHYIHNQENLIRFGGLFPPIHVQADLRRTRLLGATHVPTEGGCMMVRARDDIYRMSDLKGKTIGITKSLNSIKNDWWRIQEHQGILLMLRMNGMSEKDVNIVDFPYPDDWYDDPKMLEPQRTTSVNRSAE